MATKRYAGTAIRDFMLKKIKYPQIPQNTDAPKNSLLNFMLQNKTGVDMAKPTRLTGSNIPDKNVHSILALKYRDGATFVPTKGSYDDHTRERHSLQNLPKLVEAAQLKTLVEIHKKAQRFVFQNEEEENAWKKNFLTDEFSWDDPEIMALYNEMLECDEDQFEKSTDRLIHTLKAKYTVK